MLSIMPFSRNETNLFNFLDNMERNFLNDVPEDILQCRTDVIENNDSFSILCDLPGFEKEEISVNVADNILTITAKHQEENKKEENKDDQAVETPAPKYIRRERKYGNYKRSFSIEDIDVEAISADYKNGVLTLTLPKVAPKEPQKIEVNIGD